MSLTDKQTEILEKKEHFLILLQISFGINYASSLARNLGKKQPTVTKQLSDLEELGIIVSSERGKSKKFNIKYEVLCEYAYDLIDDFRVRRISQRDHYYIFPKEELKELYRSSIERALPCELIADFFDSYSIAILDFVPGRYKRIDELFFAMFGAMDNLKPKEKKRMVELYKVDQKKLDLVIELMSMEAIEKERVALRTAIDTRKNLTNED